MRIHPYFVYCNFYKHKEREIVSYNKQLIAYIHESYMQPNLENNIMHLEDIAYFGKSLHFDGLKK